MLGGDLLSHGGNTEVGLQLGTVSIYGRNFPHEYPFRRNSVYDTVIEHTTPAWLPNGNGALATFPLAKGKASSHFWVGVGNRADLEFLNNHHFVFGRVVQGLAFLEEVFEAADKCPEAGQYHLVQKHRITITRSGECDASETFEPDAPRINRARRHSLAQLRQQKALAAAQTGAKLLTSDPFSSDTDRSADGRSGSHSGSGQCSSSKGGSADAATGISSGGITASGGSLMSSGGSTRPQRHA